MICYLFILLFLYTATSKLLTFRSFEHVLGQSVLIGNYNTVVAWLIPTIEIVIGILLIVPKTKRIGLISSLVLMIIFTAYLIYMVNSGSRLPCRCGGIISGLSWKNHIIFNFALVALAALGVSIFRKVSSASPYNN
jgi:uncharacterized membrane protein YphA (DoxX/SURF4 family)